MNAPRFAPPYNDDAIVAWIDGEMFRADAQQFEEQLKRDERLSGRTAELMKSSQDYAGAFAPCWMMRLLRRCRRAWRRFPIRNPPRRLASAGGR